VRCSLAVNRPHFDFTDSHRPRLLLRLTLATSILERVSANHVFGLLNRLLLSFSQALFCRHGIPRTRPCCGVPLRCLQNSMNCSQTNCLTFDADILPICIHRINEVSKTPADVLNHVLLTAEQSGSPRCTNRGTNYLETSPSRSHLSRHQCPPGRCRFSFRRLQRNQERSFEPRFPADHQATWDPSSTASSTSDENHSRAEITVLRG
jgi:hypothetical protein